MKKNTLRGMSRRQLMALLLEVSQENEDLRRQLEDKRIATEKCGSLAEAALRLNGLFEATQAACEQYTQNVKLRCAHLERAAREQPREEYV